MKYRLYKPAYRDDIKLSHTQNCWTGNQTQLHNRRSTINVTNSKRNYIYKYTMMWQTQQNFHHNHHHHYQLPPWFRSFHLFRHRRIAIVSWGVHDLFFLEVCSWWRVSAVRCCPFFQGGWSNFVLRIWVSRLVFQRSLVLSLWLRF